MFERTVVMSPFPLRKYLNEQMWFQVLAKQIPEQKIISLERFPDYTDTKKC